MEHKRCVDLVNVISVCGCVGGEETGEKFGVIFPKKKKLSQFKKGPRFFLDSLHFFFFNWGQITN